MDVEYFNKNAGAVADSALRIVSARRRQIADLKAKRPMYDAEMWAEIDAQIKKKNGQIDCALSCARHDCKKIASRVRHHIRRDALLKESAKTGHAVSFVSDAEVTKRLHALSEAENALLKRLV